MIYSTGSDAIHDVLKDIVQTKREEVARRLPARAEWLDRARDARPTRGFAAALSRAGEVRLLAEIKRRSPSAGEIRAGAEVAEIARSYERGGAAALSVLTDEGYFGGSLAALEEAGQAVEIPLLRKDFIIDPVQVLEARAAGADAILLIARILTNEQLQDLEGRASELGMDALVEIHSEEELNRVMSLESRLIGINNRDLRTFETDLDLSLRLAPSVPLKYTLVAESGIRTAEDVEGLGAAGVDAILVGESLMREADVCAAAAGMVGHLKRSAGRR